MTKLTKSFDLTIQNDRVLNCEIEIYFSEEENEDYEVDRYEVISIVDEDSLEDIESDDYIDDKIWDWIENRNDRLIEEIKSEV